MLTGCSSITVRPRIVIDYRCTVKCSTRQKYNSANPAYGTYYGVKINVDF